MAQKALSGIKVLEWSSFVAGPCCAKLLADLGAEVIKIEEPGKGDVSRSRGPFLNDVPHPERSGLFLYLNTNKLGITLDMKNPGARKIFLELIKQADILVEDNSPVMMEEMGLAFDDLKKVNPRLIMTSITPFGQTGPYRDYKSYPLNAFHSGGEGYITPSGSHNLEREPLRIAKYFGERAVSNIAAGSVIAALFAREATGSGQHIDISKQEALVWLDAWDIQSYALSGSLTSRTTKVTRARGIYECKDGYMVFAPVGAKEELWWSYFYQALIYPEQDERFNDPKYISEHRKEMGDLRKELMMKRTRQEIYETPPARLIPLAPYNRVDDVVDSPQMKARNYFVEFDHPEAGKLRYPSAPYRFSETPWSVESPAPLLGQHNEEVYCNRLGYSKEDLVKLREGEII